MLINVPESTIAPRRMPHLVAENHGNSLIDSQRTKVQTVGPKEDVTSSADRPDRLAMNGTSGAAAAGPTPMFVRALYPYEADDRASLSFNQGDIIQVITQLESGWWDGVIKGVRGWFPSNYCEVVTRPENGHQNGDAPGEPDDADGESEADDDFDDLDESDDMDSDGNRDASPGLPLEGAENREQEEAAYWIPQATPDGRLFYFNTLTGVSTMELPLETPTSATETGPRDRSNVNVPEQTRPPPEMLASGYERDEDDTDYEEGNSASEREGESILLAAQDATARNGKPAHATGLSPTTSFDSVGGMSPLDKTRNGATDFYSQSQNMTMGAVQAAASMPAMGTTTTSFTTNPVGQLPPASVSRSFFDDGSAVPLTWTRLVENMQLGVERYRQAINNSNRSEYVRRAEDISDHLRLLLAAGSGTTDNHSGNPSIISTNKALYPHFRDMMSKFSKLVLSSHIAAADWPTADSYAKCLQEADGVLSGVYGYVEVARQQRGEEIPRLIPGFTMGSYSGGNWQGNGLGSRDTAPFMDQDDEVYIEPTARLDTDLLMKLDDLKKVVVASIRRLDDQLTLHDKIISTQRHEMISDAVCTNATKVLEGFQPWLAMVESINLAPLGAKNPNIHISLNNPQLIDFSAQKQRLYDLISDLMISCQAVAGPLGDEWSELRSDPLEDRLKDVRISAKQLETCTSQLILSLQHLLEMMPHEDEILRNAVRHHANGGPVRTTNQLRQDTSRPSTRNGPPVDVPLSPGAFADEVDNIPEHYRKGENSKVHKFFGEVPAPMQPVRTSDETPNFLKLDHENEISYDTKVTPPQLRGGTLRGLVEQLTRHDKLDSGFNHTFLLTYRSFTSAAELFDLLVQRFTIQPPGGISNQDLQMWVERKQKPIRLRVVNILKTWFDTYWMEGQDEISKSLIRKVFAFAKDSVATTNTAGAQPLMAVLEQRMLGQETTAKRLVLTLNTTTPAPIMPKNMKKLKFLDIDVTEFARQLTIIESRLYGKIKPTECLNKTWQRKLDDGSEPAVNVKALILHSNQLTNWVAELILTQNDVKRRVAVIKHFVSVADKCRALNNFSTLTSIISAMSTAPISRLKRTWDQVPQRTLSTLESHRRLMGSTKNFSDYRETLHLANPPCIPFFGVYLTDLTFIEDGIPGIIKKSNLINFAKRAKTAEVIRDIQQYQNVPYGLQPVPELQEYVVGNLGRAGDVHEMYERSLQVEPREREDEKIARLLSESGFL